MTEFKTSSDSNTKAVNKVIAEFRTSLQANKEALSLFLSEIKLDNIELNASIVSKIEKLQKDLVAENNLMDKLAENIQNAKVLSVKLQYTNKCVDDLESEKTVVKSCVSEINQYLQRLVETRDSLFTVSVRQQLLDKLQLVVAMLN